MRRNAKTWRENTNILEKSVAKIQIF